MGISFPNCDLGLLEPSSPTITELIKIHNSLPKQSTMKIIKLGNNKPSTKRKTGVPAGTLLMILQEASHDTVSWIPASDLASVF